MAGLTVDLQALNGGSAIFAASGALDIGVSSLVPLANAFTRGLSVTIIAAGATTTPTVPSGLVCVAKTGPVREPRDLLGRIIGVNALKDTAEMALDAWLTKNHIDIASVRTVEVPYAEWPRRSDVPQSPAQFLANRPSQQR